MHESNFTQDILHAVMQELEKYPHGKVESLVVKVGETYHLYPESVLLHFNRISRGTRLEGAELKFLEIPFKILCKFCGKIGSVEDHHCPICSYCGSLETDPVEGNEVVVEAITFEENAANNE